MALLADGLFRSALESSPDGVLILDLAGVVQFANSSAVAMFCAHHAAGLAGAAWSALWARPEQLAARAAFQAAVGEGTGRFVGSAPGAAGGPQRLDTVVSPLRDAAGAVMALLVAIRDITALEAARQSAEARERAAAHEAQVLRSVAEMAYLTSWEVDFRSNLVRVGEPGVQAMRGGPEHAELTIGQALAMYDPENQARIREKLERARLHGESFRMDAPITRHDGTLGWVRQFAEPICEDGECVGVRGAGMDITDEMASQEILRSAQRRLDLAVQLAGLDVYEFDFDRNLLIRAGGSQWTIEQAPGQETFWPHPLELVSPEDFERVRAEWYEAQERHIPFRYEFRIKRRDGAEAWVYAVSELEREDGRPRRLVGAMMDITARKQAELEMLRTLAEMREHETRQKLLLDELNHRVKNTLATVQSIAMQTLTAVRGPQEGRDLFIERLLALSTTHDLIVKHAWTSASFRELVEATLRPYGHLYQYQGPDLRLDPNFAVSLGMAVHELATNALKHGAWREAGEVLITVAVDETRVLITWRESGGPPVAPPARRGFGSRLLQRGVAAELGGKVQLAFPQEGAVCTIEAPRSKRLRVHAKDATRARRRSDPAASPRGAWS
jgi:PAS domain S-box-containing protein